MHKTNLRHETAVPGVSPRQWLFEARDFEHLPDAAVGERMGGCELGRHTKASFHGQVEREHMGRCGFYREDGYGFELTMTFWDTLFLDKAIC